MAGRVGQGTGRQRRDNPAYILRLTEPWNQRESFLVDAPLISVLYGLCHNGLDQTRKLQELARVR